MRVAIPQPGVAVKPETHCVIFGLYHDNRGDFRFFTMTIFNLEQTKIVQCISGFSHADQYSSYIWDNFTLNGNSVIYKHHNCFKIQKSTIIPFMAHSVVSVKLYSQQ